ncbi:hypothetical protein T492DRAFT_935974 [Pavlovales sp. CCMP2436]|nr:hypothetical protein T492DRAFT_935974 [Pavlovales sp. CCMP2436]|mmetsp:Transcript_4453/g.11396  ORF Transcript_4453/g.11396 Transcript_4453/m.11396 type:complete len:143 (+) Transcript_4453:83-511(+)
MLAILCALAATGFAPTLSTSAHAPLPLQRAVGSRVHSSKMIDPNIITGGVVAIAGSVGGVLLVMFTEEQGTRSIKRGALSNEQQQKFAGKFLEDIEADQSGTIDDVVSKMEAALGVTPAPAVPAAEEKTDTSQVPKNSSDGW